MQPHHLPSRACPCELKICQGGSHCIASVGAFAPVVQAWVLTHLTVSRLACDLFGFVLQEDSARRDCELLPNSMACVCRCLESSYRSGSAPDYSRRFPQPENSPLQTPTHTMSDAACSSTDTSAPSQVAGMQLRQLLCQLRSVSRRKCIVAVPSDMIR